MTTGVYGHDQMPDEISPPIVVNGRTSTKHLIKGRVLQGNNLELLLRNVYIHEALQTHTANIHTPFQMIARCHSSVSARVDST